MKHFYHELIVTCQAFSSNLYLFIQHFCHIELLIPQNSHAVSHLFHYTTSVSLKIQLKHYFSGKTGKPCAHAQHKHTTVPCGASTCLVLTTVPAHSLYKMWLFTFHLSLSENRTVFIYLLLPEHLHTPWLRVDSINISCIN